MSKTLVVMRPELEDGLGPTVVRPQVNGTIFCAADGIAESKESVMVEF